MDVTVTMKNRVHYTLANLLYKICFPVYRVLYEVYKQQIDAKEIDFCKDFIQPGSTVLDLGANIGFYSQIFSQIVGPSGKIECFEPDVINYKHLKNRVHKLKNVTINQMAISETNTPLKIFTSNRLNVDHRTYPVDDYDEVYTVPATSIDNYVDNRFTVDFIKMDLQGFEYHALKGMQKTISKNPTLIILTELMPQLLPLFNISLTEYLGFIQSLNLKIFIFTKSSLSELSQADIKKYQHYKDADYDNIVLCKNYLR